MSKALKWLFPILLAITFFLLEVMFGSVRLPLGEVISALFGQKVSETTRLIVVESRLPRAITASLAGSGLAICGLLMQRFFQNPLAGPSVLGITSGASLGVALVVLLTGGALAAIGIVLGAFFGSMVILLIILLFALRVQRPVTLLIFGLMVGYMVSAAVILLQFGSSKEALRSFVFWGMGSFSDMKWSEISVLSVVVIAGFFWAFSLARKLDLWSLGESYARSMGLNHRQFRIGVLLLTGIITSIVTAYCGPIAFIGLAVPHLARGFWKSGKHAVLIPAVAISGMIIGLGCDLIARLPGAEGALPLNAVTSFMGAPVVIAIILKGRRVF
ncbi:FecCD family ABC transporter permease [Sanyastnella coralliicola]|uniref:FecCD family ABC transporter permease n=1 Tax=Sanyastnella coralliicola TaxID=3069118 RepID=UPI0027BA60D6|nr:iron ABC transporter permease [Longitalea sp. SCSIO 12813]